MKADLTIDCIGLYCPMPIANAARKLKEMKEDEVLEILADDEGIKADMPAWCQATGHSFLGMVEENGEIRVYVRKQGKG